MYDCGRKYLNSAAQMTKDTYICSLHFIYPMEENPDPIIVLSSTEQLIKKEAMRRKNVIDEY